MAISRRTKIILVVLAIPLVLLLAFILFLKVYFTSERLKAILLPKIQAATHRDVTVQGISLSFFPTIGVDVRGLSLANARGLGFSEQPMVTLAEFFVEVKLLPLLAQRMEINRLSLKRPHILLEVSKNGEKNYSNPPEKGEKLEGERGFAVTSSKGGSFLLSNFEISDGEVEYIDRKEDHAVRLKGLDTRLRVETIGEVNELRTESEVNVASFSYGSIEKPFISNIGLRLNQKSTIHAEENTLTMERGELEVQGVKLAMSGSLTAIEEKPFVDFTIGSEAVDLRPLLELIPRSALKEAQNAEVDGTGRFKASIKGELAEGKQPDVSIEALVTNGRIHYPTFPKSITSINLKATLVSTASNSNLEVSELSAKLGENPVKMRLVLNDLSDPTLNGYVEGVLNLAEVKDFYPLEPGKTLSGVVRVKASVAGRTGQPETMKASGVLELQDVLISSTDAPAQKFNGLITFNNQVVETKGLRVKYGPSDLSISFLLKNYLSALLPSKFAKQTAKVTQPSMSVSLSSSYFESTPSNEPLVIPPFDIDATIAIGKLVYRGKEPFECTDLRGSVSSSERVIRLKNISLRALEGSMNATGTIDLRKSKQPQFDLAVEVAEADGHLLLRTLTSFGDHVFGKFSLSAKLKGAFNDSLGFVSQTLAGDGVLRLADGKLIGHPVMTRLASFLDLPEMKELAFKSWSHTFRVADGRVNTPGLKVATGGTDFLLTGWQGFDGSLDYKLTVKLSETLSSRFMGSGVGSQVADLFKDKEGRVTLFLVVGGSTDDPKFRWDKEAAKERLREKVLEEVEKKKGEVREKAKEGIQEKLEEGKEKLKEKLKKLFKKP